MNLHSGARGQDRQMVTAIQSLPVQVSYPRIWKK